MPKYGLPSLGRIRGFEPLKAMKPFSGGIKPAPDLKTEQDLLDSWTARAGYGRALEALEVWKTVASKNDGGTATLPELLAEAFIKKRGLRYKTQVELAFATPDVVIFDHAQNPQDPSGAKGAMIWRIQGDFWHERPEAKARDPLQKDRLLRTTVYGQPVYSVVDVWESEIYKSEAVFEQALLGVEIPKGAV